MADKFSVASEIIKGRELLGMTQAQLSEQSQVSLSAIKGYETGRNLPGAKEIKQLCQVLRVSPNRLIYGVENPFPERTWSDTSIRSSEPRNTITSRKRIEHLIQLLSSSESDAIYSIVYSIATARHGVEVSFPLATKADLESGATVFLETGKFNPYLHANLLVDPKKAREYANAILVAADETDAVNKGDR